MYATRKCVPRELAANPFPAKSVKTDSKKIKGKQKQVNTINSENHMCPKENQ